MVWYRVLSLKISPVHAICSMAAFQSDGLPFACYLQHLRATTFHLQPMCSICEPYTSYKIPRYYLCTTCMLFLILPIQLHAFSTYRRKFRSETSDNMDSWKAEVRRVRREKIRRKKMQVREKVGTSRNTVFFQWFVAPEGPKVGSLKRRVRSELARWEMNNCTPLWREAH